MKYMWKHIESGEINPYYIGDSKDNLFENSGFGAVRVDEPVKNFVAVSVKYENGKWVEDNKSLPNNVLQPTQEGG